MMHKNRHIYTYVIKNEYSNSKVRVHVYIRKDIWNSFKNFILEKHGTYKRGLFSEEVEKALIVYMHLHAQNAQILDFVKSDGSFRLIKRFLEVLQFIAKKYGVKNVEELELIPKSSLEEAIFFIRGKDRRTINSWREAFLKAGLVEDYDRVSYRINWEKVRRFGR